MSALYSLFGAIMIGIVPIWLAFAVFFWVKDQVRECREILSRPGKRPVIDYLSETGPRRGP